MPNSNGHKLTQNSRPLMEASTQKLWVIASPSTMPTANPALNLTRGTAIWISLQKKGGYRLGCAMSGEGKNPKVGTKYLLKKKIFKPTQMLLIVVISLQLNANRHYIFISVLCHFNGSDLLQRMLRVVVWQGAEHFLLAIPTFASDSFGRQYQG